MIEAAHQVFEIKQERKDKQIGVKKSTLINFQYPQQPNITKIK